MEVEKLVTDVLRKHKVVFCFIGKGAAIIHGFPGTTIDVDIFPKKNAENNSNLVDALKELGFDLDEETILNILQGKDFIQFSEPFPMDLVFAPDGIENFEEAEVINIDGIPVLSLRDIIKSKETAGRKKDLMDLKQLKDFERYKKKNKI